MFHDQLSLYRSYSREETRDGEQLNCNGTKENQTECTQVNCATPRINLKSRDNFKQNVVYMLFNPIYDNF